MMTNADLYAIWEVPIENVRWQGSVDSEEYLSLVTYLVQRQSKEAA